jgi:hypothetical protein
VTKYSWFFRGGTIYSTKRVYDAITVPHKKPH